MGHDTVNLARPRARRVNWVRLTRLSAFAASLGALTLYAVWPWLPGGRGSQPRTIVLYGFSILGEVMNEGVLPAFQADWQARHREWVEFATSFAGSGTITNQLILGVPAEVAILSLELDALRLAEAGVLAGPTWSELPHSGVLNRTPLIILVRPGNPKAIHDFADLARPGIGVVHPDPLTSGGAQWAILAEYGSALRQTGDPEQAYQQLLGIWRNVVAQSASARGARTQFESGFGDALITYEQEAIYDLGRGRLQAAIVYPASTILSEHIVVALDRNIQSDEGQLIQAFVEFLWGDPAQQVFVAHGFRSVTESLNAANPDLGVIDDPFTVSDLGGWPQAKREIIDGVWQGQVLEEIGR
jgi:sulfate transport system substrate-binding protein